MAKQDKRAERYTWGKDSIKVELPQCHDCTFNSGPIECDRFGIKPEKYISNKFKCPEKIPE